MNLDEQLRAALNQEAEMQKAPAPDVDRLIIGGRVRRRRRNTARFGVAAAVAVLVGGGAYGVTQIDHARGRARPRTPPPERPRTTCRHRDHNLEPGTYRMLVGDDATGAAIAADLTFDSRPGSAGHRRSPAAVQEQTAMAAWPSTRPMGWPPGPAARQRS